MTGIPLRSPAFIIAVTLFTMLPLAANSLLARAAIGADAIDPASFTTVRLLSGAAMLWLIAVLSGHAGVREVRGSWASAAMLFAYAAAFSFAYIDLSAGTGALILFGCVQATMWLVALWRGERPHGLAWLGLVAACGGLVYLMSPGLTAPPPLAAGLMAAAGVAWGVYSLHGRGSADPLADTAGNFVRSIPLTIALSLVWLGDLTWSAAGLQWAVISGALASGVGYALWYSVLPQLSATRAATVQLSVPVIAALAGVVLLDEVLTLRLVLAAVLILGGIGLTLFARSVAAGK
ncbi:MAG: DMT family transporter [Pseudomonadota bacterium]